MKKEFIQYNIGLKSKESFFEIIWHDYGKKISWYISQMIKGDESAEDIFQEVMMKLYNSIDSYNPLYSFNTWMYRVVRNYCYDYLKRKRIQINENSNIDEFTTSENPEDQYISKNIDENIRRAFDKLKIKEKEAAYLRLYEKKTFREIGNLMNEKTTTAKAIYQRAQKKLQYYLKDYDYEK